VATTVLVVEDELKIRELLRSYLEREGWSVLTTGSGAEALALAADPRAGRCPRRAHHRPERRRRWRRPHRPPAHRTRARP